MQWEVEEKGIECSGICLQSMVDAFGELRVAVSRLFADEGVGPLERDGHVRIDPGGWYPIEIELRVLRRMFDRVGESTIHTVGTRVPANAVFPPGIVDLDGAMAALDVAYHLNHRKDGTPMFDPSTGTMLEGLGHFRWQRTGDTTGCVVAPGPFPCVYNEGLVLGVARRFAPRARVTLDPKRGSLRDGAPTSTYVVTW